MRMPNGNKQRRVLIRPGIQVFLQMELGFRVKIYNPLLVTLAEDNAFWTWWSPIRFRCQAFLHPGPTPWSVGFAGPGGAFGIGPVSVCLDREVVNLAGILWYIKPQQFRHLFIVLLPDGVDNDVPVLRHILP